MSPFIQKLSQVFRTHSASSRVVCTCKLNCVRR